MLRSCFAGVTFVTMTLSVAAFAQTRARARPPATPAATVPKVAPPPDPAFTLDRKPPLLVRKSKELLIRELAQFERMLAQTPERSPDFPMLLRRLAEGYAELEAKAERERAAAQAAADAIAEAERKAPREKPRPQMPGTGTVM